MCVYVCVCVCVCLHIVCIITYHYLSHQVNALFAVISVNTPKISTEYEAISTVTRLRTPRYIKQSTVPAIVRLVTVDRGQHLLDRRHKYSIGNGFENIYLANIKVL